MAIENIERDFKSKVCESLRLEREGIDRYRVFTPFLLEDGDHLAIVLKRQADHWMLTDEGHTFMHLTYDLDEKDLQRGNRQKIITNALSTFQVSDRDGELVLGIPDGRYGDALYSFIQALTKISDVTYLSRERVRSWRISANSWKRRFRQAGGNLTGETPKRIRRANTWSTVA
jgi:hypothetical protein